MKIAFDLHGVLDTYPHLMKPILSKILSNVIDIEISILSGAFSEDIIKECEIIGYKKDVHYNSIISILDYGINELKLPHWTDVSPRTGKTGTYFNDDLWWAMKAILCDIHDIDVLYDDKEQYIKYFGYSHKTNFILFNKYTHKNILTEIKNTLIEANLKTI